VWAENHTIIQSEDDFLRKLELQGSEGLNYSNPFYFLEIITQKGVRPKKANRAMLPVCFLKERYQAEGLFFTP